jgi:hypothetical protein
MILPLFVNYNAVSFGTALLVTVREQMVLITFFLL